MGRTVGARNSDYQERRNTLINKVRERLSLQNGEPPSYRELAFAAGVSVPTLRHYFGSREQIIKSIFTHSLAGAATHLSRARMPETGDLEASLTGFLQRVVAGWTKGNVGALHRIGLAEGLRSPATALDYLTDVLEPTLQALESRLAVYREQGRIVECNTRHAALMLLSPMVLALLHQHDLGGTRCRPLAIPELITEHVKVFVRAYRPG